jgi:protein SCO1
MTLPRRHLLICAAAASVLAACGKSGAPGTGNAKFNSIDLTGAEYARDFRLTDQHGQERSLSDFKGKLVAVFFGFTQCPDVCPTSLAELAQVKQALGADAGKLQGIFITVDPARDTPEILKPYMESFDPSFIALRGTPEQTAAVAKDFKVFYAKVPGKTDDSYTMDHTAGIYVFDGEGRIRLFSRHGNGAEGLTADLRQLLPTTTP